MAAGEDLCLECEVAEAGEVIWLKGTERIQPSGRFQLLSRGRQQTLLIRDFSAEDQGEYRCAPAWDPVSVAAAAFQGMSSRAQRAQWREEPWDVEWASSFAHWFSRGTAGGPLEDTASHQERLRPGVGRCTDPCGSASCQSPHHWHLRSHRSLSGILANAALSAHCWFFKALDPYTLSPLHSEPPTLSAPLHCQLPSTLSPLHLH